MVVSGGRREWRCCVAALRGALPLLHAHTCCSLCARRSVNISSCGRSACSLSLSTTTFVCSMDSSRAATSASLRLTSTCISLKRSIERCTHTRQGQRASNEQAQQATGSHTASKAASKRSAKHIHTCKSYCSLLSLSSLPLTSSSRLCSSSLLASASNLCVVGWAGDRGGCEGG